MMFTKPHPALVEVAHRGGKTLEFAQGEARAGRIAAVQSPDGWLMTRDEAEAVIREWLDE